MDSAESTKERLLAALAEPLAAPSGRMWRATRPYRNARNRLAALIFDRGLDMEQFELELDHFRRDTVPYQPSARWWLRKALRTRRIEPTDVFVDFGSGKGRVVLQAARRPFARVVGVEISDRLNEVARANIDRRRRTLRCPEIELVTADAAAFGVPDDMTYAYFYYPFGGETFEAVIANIVESLDRRPRRVTLIYACPKRAEVILATGRFTLAQTVRSRAWPDVVAFQVTVYVSEPAAA